MPVYHAGPFGPGEFEEAVRRSGWGGEHQGISSGREWCIMKSDDRWLAGTLLWWRVGRPKTAKEAVTAMMQATAGRPPREILNRAFTNPLVLWRDEGSADGRLADD